MTKTTLLFIVGVFAVLVAVAALWYASTPRAAAGADALAQCLAQKNVTMYGAYWCPHCANQKALFGTAFRYVKYVECTQEVDRCNAEGVKGYPTWVFPDGSRAEGETPLATLAQKSGCPALQ